MIGIIDYGAGNLRSVLNAFESLNLKAKLVGRGEDMENKTMIRFIGSIIIALAIEALMLVFKFAITAPDHIINAIYLIGGVAILMIALSIYLFATKQRSSH